MAEFIRVDMNNVWASAGDSVPPSLAKISEGWLVEAVPRQWWNWMQNRIDTNMAYLFQKGLPEWDAGTEYFAGKTYIQYRGNVYKALLSSTAVEPTAVGQTSWQLAFADSTAFLEAVKSLPVQSMTIPAFGGNGAATLLPFGGVGQQVLASSTASQARGFIDAQQANSNLSALSGTVAATNTLPYYSSATAMNTTPLTGFGRSIVAAADAAGIKTLLALGNAADYTVQTDILDSAPNRILTVGAFGLGGYAGLITNPDVATRPTGFYDVDPSVSWASRPIPGWTRISHISHGNGAGFATQYAVANFASSSGTERYFVRTCAAGVWSGWAEYYTSRSFTLTTSVVDDTIGRVSRIGDLGYAGPSITDSNANTPRASGAYAFVGGANTPVSNFQMASQDWGGDGTGWQAQFGQEIGNNRAFFRSILKSGAALTPWAELYHTGNVQQLTNTITSGVVAQVNAQLLLKQDIATVNVTSGPTDSIDPNELTIPWALVSHANTPDSSRYWFVNTMFYANKGMGGKAQTAIEYNPTGPARSFVRSCISNVWTVWVRTDANAVAPTATRLATARTINGVGFDGTGNISIPSQFAVGENLTGPAFVSMRAAGNAGGVDYDVRLQVEQIAAGGTPGTGVLGIVARDVQLSGSISTGNWFSSTGPSGWVNSTYGGGIYQTNPWWVSVYGGKSFHCDASIQALGGFVGGGANITNLQHGNITSVPQSQTANGWTMLPGGTILQWMKATESTSATDFKFFPRSFPTACTSVSCCIDAGAMGDGAAYGVNMRIVDSTKFVTTHAGTYGGGGVVYVIATGY